MYFRVYYPYHPLNGRRLRLLRRFEGPPAAIVTETEDGTELQVPAWMAMPGASEFELVDEPRIEVRGLTAMAALVRRWRSECSREAAGHPNDRAAGSGPGEAGSVGWKGPSDPESALAGGAGTEPAATGDGKR